MNIFARPISSVPNVERETLTYLSTTNGGGQTAAQIVTIDTYIKLIKYGSGITLSSLTANFSLISPFFVTQVSQDLRWLAILNATVPLTLTWNDGTNTYAMAPVAVGTGETYLELIVNGNFSSAEPPGTAWVREDGWTITGSVGDKASGTGRFMSQGVIWNKLLIKYSFDLTSRTSGAIEMIMGSSPSSGLQAIVATYTGYRTANGDMCYLYASATTAVLQIDNVSGLKVLTPSATGFTFTGGSGASFNPNAATKSLTIVRTP